jgi:hypothetical protein
MIFDMNKEKLQKRMAEDEALYKRFGKPLEGEQRGKFVAIAPDGALIIDDDQIRVLERAIRQFGSGNFAFRKIGSRALGKWRVRVGHEPEISIR